MNSTADYFSLLPKGTWNGVRFYSAKFLRVAWLLRGVRVRLTHNAWNNKYVRNILAETDGKAIGEVVAAKFSPDQPGGIEVKVLWLHCKPYADRKYLEIGIFAPVSWISDILGV